MVSFKSKVDYVKKNVKMVVMGDNEDFRGVVGRIVSGVLKQQIDRFAKISEKFECEFDFNNLYQFMWFVYSRGDRYVAFVKTEDIDKFIKENKEHEFDSPLESAEAFESTADIYVFEPKKISITKVYKLASMADRAVTIHLVSTKKVLDSI